MSNMRAFNLHEEIGRLLRHEQEYEEEEEEESDGTDEEDDDEIEEICVLDRLPTLTDVDENGKPLFPRVYPPPPTNIEVPNYAIDDAASVLRRSLQTAACQQGLPISHRQIEGAIECLMKFPGALKSNSEALMHRFLFGWESLVWRNQLLPAAETRKFVKSLVSMSVDEMNKTRNRMGINGPAVRMQQPTEAELDKFISDIIPALSYWNRFT